MTARATAVTGPPRGAFVVLLLTVLGAFTAQQILVPVLAPLSREVGLSAVAIGSVISAAAVCFAVSSLFWGRIVSRVGVRIALLVGLGLGLIGFAVVSALAIARDWSPGWTWAAMLATRSVLYGVGIGAVPVAAMVFVAQSTPAAADRTARLGQVGAAQGVAVALGPALAALLGSAGLLGPVWLAPLLVATGLVVVLVGVRPASPEPTREQPGERPAAPRLRPWDPRLWPLLVVGALAYLALGLMIIVLGFLVGDRLALTPDETVRSAGLVSFAAGVVLVGVQGVAVPRLRWAPARLLRVGLPIAAVALIGLAVADTLPAILVGMTVFALGLGLASPGISAAPTLAVGPAEQGAVAGLVQAAIGVTFVVGPVLGTFLYGLGDHWPAAAAAAAVALAALFAYLHPAFGSLDPESRARDAAGTSLHTHTNSPHEHANTNTQESR